MVKLPQEVVQAWEHRDGPIVFATVDNFSQPNIIYATCMTLLI